MDAVDQRRQVFMRVGPVTFRLSTFASQISLK